MYSDLNGRFLDIKIVRTLNRKEGQDFRPRIGPFNDLVVYFLRVREHMI